MAHRVQLCLDRRWPIAFNFAWIVITLGSVRQVATLGGIRANYSGSLRTSGSTASMIEPAGALGVSKCRAPRTVLRATPARRATSLMDNPSALCSRRISAQFSKSNNPPYHLRQARASKTWVWEVRQVPVWLITPCSS